MNNLAQTFCSRFFRCIDSSRFKFCIRNLLVLSTGLFSSFVFSAAGDVVNNIATVNYVYQGSALLQESSPSGNNLTGIGNGIPTSFLEDRLINFTVSSSDATVVNVASLQLAGVLTFTVTNNGNATQDFLLTALNTSPGPFASPDNFDPVLLQVFVENGSNAGYLPAEDTEIFVDELAPGATAIVYVIADFPVAAIGDAAAIALVAQSAEGGAAGQGVAITNDDNGSISPAGSYSNGALNISAGVVNSVANTPGLETVFNDPAAASPDNIDSSSVSDVAANGQHSDVGVFYVQTAAAPSVVLNKTVLVIDTLGGIDPHAGATLRYQIDVVVGGGSNIDNLVITDSIPANTTYTPSSLLLNGIAQTDVVDAPVDYSGFNGSAIVVDLSQGGTVSVAPSTPNLITFDVTIN